MKKLAATGFSFLFLNFVLLENSFSARLINLGNDFENFVKSSEAQPEDVVTKNWEKVESQYQDIYDIAVYWKDTPNWEARFKRRRVAFFSQYKELSGKMIELFHNADKLVNEEENQFRKYFPDLASDIPVIFMPSLMSFNGQVLFIPQYQRNILMIGVDLMVQRNDNPNIVFSHEYFHVYHGDKIQGKTGSNLATPLWKEGFATFVSGIINPEATETELLMQDDLAVLCSDQREVTKLAKLFLDIIEVDNDDLYMDWFAMGGPTKPYRRGYCLGYNVIKELTKTYPLLEMASWNEARFIPEIKKVLSEMSSK